MSDTQTKKQTQIAEYSDHLAKDTEELLVTLDTLEKRLIPVSDIQPRVEGGKLEKIAPDRQLCEYASFLCERARQVNQVIVQVHAMMSRLEI